MKLAAIQSLSLIAMILFSISSIIFLCWYSIL